MFPMRQFQHADGAGHAHGATAQDGVTVGDGATPGIEEHVFPGGCRGGFPPVVGFNGLCLAVEAHQKSAAADAR